MKKYGTNIAEIEKNVRNTGKIWQRNGENEGKFWKSSEKT